MHCLGSFPLHSMLLNFHEFAFEGQNMKFTMNILLGCILYCTPGLFFGLFFVWLFWHHMIGIFMCFYSSGKTNFQQINEDNGPSRWQFSALQAPSKHLGPQYWTWKTWEGKLLQESPLSHHVIGRWKMISDWTSLKGRIWCDKVLENGTKLVIGQTMERNVVQMWAAVSLWAALRDIPKNGCEGDYRRKSLYK